MPNCFRRTWVLLAQVRSGVSKTLHFLVYPHASRFVGPFVSPKGCQDDCGREGQQRGAGSSRAALRTSSLDVCGLSDAEVLETERVLWLLLLFATKVDLVAVFLFHSVAA